MNESRAALSGEKKVDPDEAIRHAKELLCLSIMSGRDTKAYAHDDA